MKYSTNKYYCDKRRRTVFKITNIDNGLYYLNRMRFDSNDYIRYEFITVNVLSFDYETSIGIIEVKEEIWNKLLQAYNKQEEAWDEANSVFNKLLK